jgi:hypothetical protein
VQGVVLNGGSGGNTINVQATQASTPVTINAGTGANTIILGETTFGSPGSSLNYILGPVTINGSAADTLTVNDQGTTADRTYTLDNGSVSWGSGSVTASGVASLTLNGGVGSNIYAVAGTLAGTTTTLNGGAGLNEFGVEDQNLTMDSLQGALVIHGQGSPQSILFLHDSYNPVGQTYTFTVGQVIRTGMAPITYDGLVEVNLYTGMAGGNTVNVQSIAANVDLNLAVGSGDTVYLGEPLNDGSNTAMLADIAGMVEVNASNNGAPTVIVDNSADTTAHEVTTGQDAYGLYLDGLASGQLYFNVNPATQVQVNPGSGDVTGLDAFFALLGQQPQ